MNIYYKTIKNKFYFRFYKEKGMNSIIFLFTLALVISVSKCQVPKPCVAPLQVFINNNKLKKLLQITFNSNKSGKQIIVPMIQLEEEVSEPVFHMTQSTNEKELLKNYA
jgi:hypothetical protein